MTEYTWGTRKGSGVWFNNQQVAEVNSGGKYFWLRKDDGDARWSVVGPVKKMIRVTATMDCNQSVLFSTNGILNGAKLMGYSDVTAAFDMPEVLEITMEGCTLVLPDGSNPVCVSVSSQDNVFTHFKEHRNKWIGFGGIKVTPSSFEMLYPEDVVGVVEGETAVLKAAVGTIPVEGVAGERVYVPGTKIAIWTRLPQGTPYRLYVPQAMTMLSCRGEYYPYGPDGTAHVTADMRKQVRQSIHDAAVGDVLSGVINEGAVERGQLLRMIEDEIVAIEHNNLWPDYLDFITEILEGTPSPYSKSEYPLHAALKWAVALKRGK